jgi:hypothetical protein
VAATSFTIDMPNTGGINGACFEYHIVN